MVPWICLQCVTVVFPDHTPLLIKNLEMIKPGMVRTGISRIYTILTNFGTKYLVMSKVYTDVSGRK